MKKLLMFGVTVLCLVTAPLALRSLQEEDVIGTAEAGEVVSIAEAEPFVPRGFAAWFFGAPQTDRIAVTTSTGRYLVSGLSSLPQGASVEVRDNIDGKRVLCVSGSKVCGNVWNDATAVPVQNEDAAFFREIMKWGAILAAITVALGGASMAMRL